MFTEHEDIFESSETPAIEIFVFSFCDLRHFLWVPKKTIDVINLVVFNSPYVVGDLLNYLNYLDCPYF